MQKVISITEAMKRFPDFVPDWEVKHPGCEDWESVVLGNPKFGTVRHVVVVEIDESGDPVKPLYDKMRFEEGPAGRDFPGAIVIPWFELDGRRYVVLIRNERPVRKSNALEFPQGYVEGDETKIETALRELMEETDLSVSYLLDHSKLEPVRKLGDICPEPDWFPRAATVISVRVDPPDWFSQDMPVSVVGKEALYCFPPEHLDMIRQIDSSTTLAALALFLVLKPWSFDDPYHS